MLFVAWFLIAGLTACEQQLEYKVYTNSQLPFTFEVPTTWTTDSSISGLIKFYNAEKSMGINCEVGYDFLMSEEKLDEVCVWQLNRYKSNINTEQELIKGHDHYILKWKDVDGDYYIDGGKCVNGYISSIFMVSDSISLSQASEIFQHVFESISPNPDFEKPTDLDVEE